MVRSTHDVMTVSTGEDDEDFYDAEERDEERHEELHATISSLNSTVEELNARIQELEQQNVQELKEALEKNEKEKEVSFESGSCCSSKRRNKISF